MMAVSMCTHAAVVALGKLMIAALAFTHNNRSHGGRGFSCRFARDRIDCSTEHRAEQQQQSRKAPNASQGESKDHRGELNSWAFTFCHSPRGRARRETRATRRYVSRWG